MYVCMYVCMFQVVPRPFEEDLVQDLFPPPFWFEVSAHYKVFVFGCRENVFWFRFLHPLHNFPEI